MPDKLFKAYVANSMWFSARGQCIEKKYTDLIKNEKVDERSGDEIALDIIEKAGLTLV